MDPISRVLNALEYWLLHFLLGKMPGKLLVLKGQVPQGLVGAIKVSTNSHQLGELGQKKVLLCNQSTTLELGHKSCCVNHAFLHSAPNIYLVSSNLAKPLVVTVTLAQGQRNPGDQSLVSHVKRVDVV